MSNERTPIRLYRYVGPEHLRQRAVGQEGGAPIAAMTDLKAWMHREHQRPDASALIAATYVIDVEGSLRLADRHSEHVACAGGRPVRSAGEVYFGHEAHGWEVTEISNQSMGYCPEPESWPHVAAALRRIPIRAPAHFTFACTFRRCLHCDHITLVKEGLFECGVCGAKLPTQWNVDPEGPLFA